MSNRQPVPPADRAALKRAALAQMLAEEGIGASPDPTIPHRADATASPLSYSQELLFLLDQGTAGLTAYNGPIARRLRGRVSPALVEQALDRLVARHPVLRTVFRPTEPATQTVLPHEPLRLIQVDLQSHPAETREAALAAAMAAVAQTPFDLTRERQFRACLYQLAETEFVLLLVSHHIVMDGWSLGILFRELSATYAALARGEEPALARLPITFGDYAAWQREVVQSGRMEPHIAYWRTTLAAPLPAPELPTDRPRPATQQFDGDTATRVVPAKILASLKQLAQNRGASLYMVLVAGYQALLHRYSGQDDIIIGSPVAGRNQRETEGLLGYFNNPLVLRSRFDPGLSFGDFVARVRDRCLGAYDHQELPFERLVHEVAGEGRQNDAPLFRCVLTMQETHASDLTLPEIEASPVRVEHGSVKFDLTLLVSEHRDGLHFDLEYRTDLFNRSTVDRLLGHLETLLAGAAADPTMAIDLLPLLTAAEHRALKEWNATEDDSWGTGSLVPLIARHAAAHSGRDAVRSGDRSLSYGDLHARATILAQRLVQLGAGPTTPVGLCIDRSPELMTGVLGIWLAGAGYVPLLPDQPAARIQQQLAESGATLVVTTSEFRNQVPAHATAVFVDGELLGAPPTLPVLTAEHPAYVLFTSGSTGTPKGVAVSHGNLYHYTNAIAKRLGLPLDGTAEWQCGSVSTLAADLGHTAVFPALASGGTLHLVPHDATVDPGRFGEYLERYPLDLLKITPSHLRALLGDASGEALAARLPRQWLVLGGESCPWPLVTQVRTAGRCQVLNHYGPTETTVGACTYLVGDEAAPGATTVPIGRPLANMRTQVVDPNRQPVPLGVPGELYLGGAGVASGYYGRADLTAERFGGDPTGTDRLRYYRTGDRVRRLESGDLEFLGRLDGQVKVRGYRVELGEIETVLAGFPGLGQAAVALHDDRLVGYVTIDADTASDTRLTEYLDRLLPDYMVPRVWVRLDHLPLTGNGKLDRRGLAAPAAAPSAAGDPSTETERRLVAIWQEVLKKDRIGIHDNFFELGGHSLLAIRLLGRVSKTFGVRLQIRALFEAPTVSQLAAALTPTHRFETPLAALWAEVLKKPAVGRDDNFFALGGHSLLAIRLLGKISKRFGVRLQIRSLFEHPTVATLAPAIETAGGAAQG